MADKTKKTSYDVMIVGGGAAGLMAAIFASSLNTSVAILEYNEAPGKKILSTGNGRCNLTNANLSLDAYAAADEFFLKKAFAHFDNKDTIEFFSSIGLLVVEREGYFYPRSMQASTVRDYLVAEAMRRGVRFLFHKQCKRVQKEKDSFFLHCADGSNYQTKRLIIASGSKASKISGSTDDGVYLASLLGHSSRTYVPALVPLAAADACLSLASGVRTDALVTTIIDQEEVCTYRGELQITDSGVSGIVIFQSSGCCMRALEEKKEVTLRLNFLPELSSEDILFFLTSHFKRFSLDASLFYLLCGILPDRLAKALLKRADLALDTSLCDLSKEQIKKIANLLIAYPLTVTGSKGFSFAQVCAGGVKTEEIDADTMASRLVSGLYFAGEVMDVNGICGGYNLQWAWTSGAIAGKRAGGSIS